MYKQLNCGERYCTNNSEADLHTVNVGFDIALFVQVQNMNRPKQWTAFRKCNFSHPPQDAFTLNSPLQPFCFSVAVDSLSGKEIKVMHSLMRVQILEGHVPDFLSDMLDS